jgi:ankyrin repeat protein
MTENFGRRQTNMKVYVAFSTSVAILWLTLASSGVCSEAEIHKSTKRNDVEKVKALLAGGANVNAKTDRGQTALHCAPEYDAKEVAEVLLAKGADVNAKDNIGKTPLHIAASFNAKGVAELLLAKGADVNAEDLVGTTPLHVAAYYIAKEVAEVLLAGRANVDATNCVGLTALHVAAQNNAKEVAELLLAKGADVNAKTDHGLFLRHVAAKINTKGGADFTEKDLISSTPLHVAAYFNAKEVAELLLAKGADINAKVNTGLTPVEVALENSSDAVTSLLCSQTNLNTNTFSAKVAALVERRKLKLAALQFTVIGKGKDANIAFDVKPLEKMGQKCARGVFSSAHNLVAVTKVGIWGYGLEGGLLDAAGDICKGTLAGYIPLSKESDTLMFCTQWSLGKKRLADYSVYVADAGGKIIEWPRISSFIDGNGYVEIAFSEKEFVKGEVFLVVKEDDVEIVKKQITSPALPPPAPPTLSP